MRGRRQPQALRVARRSSLPLHQTLSDVDNRPHPRGSRFWSPSCHHHIIISSGASSSVKKHAVVAFVGACPSNGGGAPSRGLGKEAAGSVGVLAVRTELSLPPPPPTLPSADEGGGPCGRLWSITRGRLPPQRCHRHRRRRRTGCWHSKCWRRRGAARGCGQGKAGIFFCPLSMHEAREPAGGRPLDRRWSRRHGARARCLGAAARLPGARGLQPSLYPFNGI